MERSRIEITEKDAEERNMTMETLIKEYQKTSYYPSGGYTNKEGIKVTILEQYFNLPGSASNNQGA